MSLSEDEQRRGCNTVKRGRRRRDVLLMWLRSRWCRWRCHRIPTASVNTIAVILMLGDIHPRQRVPGPVHDVVRRELGAGVRNHYLDTPDAILKRSIQPWDGAGCSPAGVVLLSPADTVGDGHRQRTANEPPPEILTFF